MKEFGLMWFKNLTQNNFISKFFQIREKEECLKNMQLNAEEKLKSKTAENEVLKDQLSTVLI